MTYGAEVWATIVKLFHRLRDTRRAMERVMLGVLYLDKTRNEEICRKKKMGDIVQKISELKCQWAGHVYRRNDNCSTKRVLEWRLR